MNGKRAAEAHPTLVQLEGDDAGRVIALVLGRRARGEWTLGRAAGCDVVVRDDPHVSRDHARFLRAGAQVAVVDLPGSLNGTIVNGSTIEKGLPRALADGDRLRFGETMFLFRAGLSPR